MIKKRCLPPTTPAAARAQSRMVELTASSPEVQLAKKSLENFYENLVEFINLLINIVNTNLKDCQVSKMAETSCGCGQCCTMCIEFGLTHDVGGQQVGLPSGQGPKGTFQGHD